MNPSIRSVAVLGAGVMGADLAAHLANAGIRVLLFDLTIDRARQGLERARRAKPDRFFTPEAATLIEVLGFDAIDRVSAADWILEAIVEDLDLKRELLARIDTHRRPETIVSSNTSSLSIAAIAEGRSHNFKRHWLGTHFFNPPRYLQLIEVVPAPDTDPAVTARIAAFVDERLGKGVVEARDTPGFIGNRLGVFGAIRALDVAATGGYTVEEVDAITGPAIGRPKSAMFRTLDIAGLDIFAHVAADLAIRLQDDADRERFALPPIAGAMLTRGYLGEKTGQGFYKKIGRGADAKILSLDLETFDYRDARTPSLPSLQTAKATDAVGPRIRALFLGRDRAGEFLRQTLGPTLVYAAEIALTVARSIDDVDRAMRWGFAWELGPFETWDAIGIHEVIDACGIATPPPLVAELLASGRSRFRDAPLPPARANLLILQSAKEQSRVVRSNAGASLVDLGDGVLAVELHSKMNTIGGDAIDMLRAGVTEAASNFAALVIGSEAQNFSAGANLTLVLLAAQDGDWDEIDAMVRAFQGATMALKTSAVPVVAAPGGLALGGGCEICLHAHHVQAWAETYIGLVEVGVGLIPAGGGTKEMLLRATSPSATATERPHMQASVARAFETMAFAKVSTSAADAKRIGYLRDDDRVTMNRERVIADAKTLALSAIVGFRPATAATAIPAGGADLFATLSMGVHLASRAGRISDHDVLIARKLAWVLTGGNAAHATSVSEQYVLDLEREAFLSLCGETKTLERIAFTLKTGKTLRN